MEKAADGRQKRRKVRQKWRVPGTGHAVQSAARVKGQHVGGRARRYHAVLVTVHKQAGHM
jgi:hypothetical protein